MVEVTRVPLQPIAKGSLVKVWLGILVAVLLAAGLAWTAMPAGLQITATTEGTGAKPTLEDVVFVNYVGKLADGTVFEESPPAAWPVEGILPDGTPLPIANMIPGFRDALVQMQRGGSYIVEIPGALAYGDAPPPGSDIPANADLTFDIELVDFLPMEEVDQRFATLQQMMSQVEAPAEGAAAAAQ